MDSNWPLLGYWLSNPRLRVWLQPHFLDFLGLDFLPLFTREILPPQHYRKWWGSGSLHSNALTCNYVACHSLPAFSKRQLLSSPMVDSSLTCTWLYRIASVLHRNPLCLASGKARQVASINIVARDLSAPYINWNIFSCLYHLGQCIDSPWGKLHTICNSGRAWGLNGKTEGAPILNPLCQN